MSTTSLTVAAQVAVDGTDEGRARAHTLVDLLFDAAGIETGDTMVAATAAYSKAGGATKADRTELSPDQLRGVLTALATGAEGAPLNAGERLMLQGLADAAPAALPYDDNRQL